MPKRRTEAEFVQLLNEKQESQYKLLSRYVNNTTKVHIQCNDCGIEWWVSPKTMLRFRVGKACKHHISLSREQVNARIKKATSGKIEMIGEYYGAKTSTKMKCLNCGYVWSTQPYTLYSGHPNCPKEIGSAPHNTQWLKDQLVKLTGMEYSLLSEYRGTHRKVLIKHNICGSIFNMTPHDFVLDGHRCPKDAYKKIALKNMVPIEIVKAKIRKSTRGRYIIADDSTYRGTNSKCLFKDTKCGYIWEAQPWHIYYGDQGCPKCNESKGENEVRHYLKIHHYRFISQYRIDDCKDKNPLPFDFAVFNPDGSINCLIEYQGCQHFTLKGWGKELWSTGRHDKIKRDYCHKHNIPLIPIPYASKRTDILKIREIVNTYLDKYLHVNPVPSASKN